MAIQTVGIDPHPVELSDHRRSPLRGDAVDSRTPQDFLAFQE